MAREKQNPNVWYYTGKANFSVFPSRLKQGQRAVFFLSLTEIADAVELILQNETYSFEKINNLNYRLDLIVPATAASGDLPVLLKLKNKGAVFYKTYQIFIGEIDNHSLLIEEKNIIDAFPVFVKGEQETVSVDIKPYQPYYFEDEMQSSLNISIHGIKSISVRSQTYQGQDSLPNSWQREELLAVNAYGKVNETEVSAQIYDSSVNIDNNQKNSLIVKDKNWQAEFSEYNASFNDIELTSFYETLNGFRGFYQANDFLLKGIVAKSKGLKAYEKIAGNNTQGIYFLKNKEIVLGSETLVYQKKTLLREIDYTIDYELGQITFKNIFIPERAYFTVSYQYLDDNPPPITAFNLAYMPSSNYALNFSFVDKPIGKDDNRFDSHQVFGLRTDFNFNPSFSVTTELAMSKEQDLQGLAFKQAIKYQSNNFSFQESSLHTEHSFRPISTEIIKPNASNYNVELAYNPFENFYNRIDFASKTNSAGNIHFLERSFIYNATLFNLNYQFFKEEYQDYFSTPNFIDEMRDNNSLTYKLDFNYFTLKPQLEIENFQDKITSINNYESNSLGLELILENIPGLNFIAFFKDTYFDYQTTENRFQKNYGISADINFQESFNANILAKKIEDSLQLDSLLLNYGFSYRPNNFFTLAGDNSLESKYELINDENYRVLRQQANIRTMFRPFTNLAINYLFKPISAEIEKLDLREEYQAVNQLNLDYRPIDSVFINFDLKNTKRTNKFVPTGNLARKEEQNLILNQLEWQIGQKDKLSLSNEYLYNDAISFFSMETTNNQQSLKDRNNKHNLDYQHFFSKNFNAGLTYENECQKSFVSPQTSSNIETVIHKASFYSEASFFDKIVFRSSISAKETDFKKDEQQKLYQDLFFKIGLDYQVFDNILFKISYETERLEYFQDIADTSLRLDYGLGRVDLVISLEAKLIRTFAETYNQSLEAGLKGTLVF